MAEVDLDELEALLAAATPGPWRTATGDEYEYVDYWQVHGPDAQVAFDDGSAWDEYSRKCSIENRDLLVALRNAFPALLAELRELRASVKTAPTVTSVRRAFKDLGVDDQRIALQQLRDEHEYYSSLATNGGTGDGE